MVPEDLGARLATTRNGVRQYLNGIGRIAREFPLGALHLAASLIDVLAGLTSDSKGGGQARYERFVEDYFPPQYRADELPRDLYRGLRNLGLHNLSVGHNLALMNGQMDRTTHLQRDEEGRTIIRLEEVLRHLRSAVGRWERALEQDEALRRCVLERERRKPIFEVVMIGVPTAEGLILAQGSFVAPSFAASAAIRPANVRPHPGGTS